MTRSNLGRTMIAVMTVWTMTVLVPREARAACVTGTPGTNGRAARATLQMPEASLGGAIESHTSIVGFWNTTFLFGNGPDIFDQGFQQWHRDNTEMMVDNAVSPSLGNVCVGVWKQTGQRTYTLKHMTFNWDEHGGLAGTFILRMTVTLDRHGNAFAGSYAADSFDLEGKLIPELHVEGRVKSERITVR